MRIKIMVAAVAALALGALTVSSAFATPGQWDFASEVQDTYITGVQTEQNVFTVNGGTVKCEEAKFEGTALGTTGETTGGGNHWMAKDVTIHPTYSGCTAFGQKATVTTTGCDYTITPTSTTLGHVSIVCEMGKSITVKANTAGCTVTVPAQTPVNNILDFEEEGEGNKRDILVIATVGPEKVEAGKENGITYNSTGGICGASGKNGKYRGSVTTSGYSDAAHEEKNQVGIFIGETGS